MRREAQFTCARFDLNWYRRGAYDAARQFRAWLRSDAGRARCELQRIRIGATCEIRRISDIVAGEWEERVQMDLSVNYFEHEIQDVGLVENVNIDIWLDGEEPVTIPTPQE